MCIRRSTMRCNILAKTLWNKFAVLSLLLNCVLRKRIKCFCIPRYIVLYFTPGVVSYRDVFLLTCSEQWVIVMEKIAVSGLGITRTSAGWMARSCWWRPVRMVHFLYVAVTQWREHTSYRWCESNLRTNRQTDTCAHVHTYTCAHTHTCMRACAHAHNTHQHTYKHTYACAHTSLMSQAIQLNHDIF